MSNKYSQAEKLLNAILSKLPLVEEADLSILADILKNLKLLGENTALPGAFQKQAKRTAKLSENMIMEEVAFEKGINKLSQSIEKMAESFRNSVNKELDTEKIEDASQEEEVENIPLEEETNEKLIDDEVSIGREEDTPNKVATEQTFNGDPALLADFVAESREHLDGAEPLLLDLEEDSTNVDNLNTIFRAFHTIKGVAGFLGLTDVGTLSHSMENLLDLGRKGEIILNSHHIDILLQGMDCLRELIQSVEGILSDKPLMIPKNYGEICKKLSTPYAFDEPVETSNKKIGEILIERGAAKENEIEDAVSKQIEGDPRKVGEILVEDNNINPRDVAGALASQNAAKNKKSVEETIRVPVERLDQLIDSIGEAVIAQSMVYAEMAEKKLTDRTLDKKVSQSGLIMRQIQELSMSLRMVSVKSTFQKMARLVRDLSKKTGKHIDLVMEGEDTELDKSVVENIGDPLVHMIRNSVDHGIESDEERETAKKSARAKITLRAYHRAGSVVIEIEDDGKGLNRETLLKKAIERGVAEEGEQYTDQEVYRFIFAPGFSTAKVVTDVSGRGVGMDVVRRNIEALRGSVEIHSEFGKGTRISLKLPLTLAIIDGMVVNVQSEKYIIPTLSIIESIKPSKDQVESVLQKGDTIKVRGNLYTLVRLSSLFNGNGGSEHKKYHDGIVMIVEDMIGKKAGLFIDDIVGQQQVVIKNLGNGIGNVQGVAGGAIMSDGNVSLIVDVGEIVKMATG